WRRHGRQGPARRESGRSAAAASSSVPSGWLCDHVRPAAAGAGTYTGFRFGKVDQRFQPLLHVVLLPGRIGFEGFEIQPDRRTLGSGARQARDDARPVAADDAQTLAPALAVVDRIAIGEVVGGSDGQIANVAAWQAG